MQTELTEDDFRNEAVDLLKKQNCTGVIYYGNFGNYYFYLGEWIPRDEIVKTYLEMLPYMHTDDAEKFADSCKSGAVYSAMFEEFVDKYEPFMKIKTMSPLRQKDMKWKHIYEVVSAEYAKKLAKENTMETY